MRKSDVSLSYRYAGDVRAWSHVIAEVFQPQHTRPACPAHFHASIEQSRWHGLEITHYESAASIYERTRRHIGAAVEDYFFVTLPRTPAATMTLAQSGRIATLDERAMVLHHGAHEVTMSLSDMALTAVRIPGAALRARLSDPERHCITAIASERSAGALFVAMLDALMHNAPSLGAEVRERALEQLYDLLALSLEGRSGAVPRHESAAHSGHYARALRHIATHCRDPALSPRAIADACHVSLRYLHKLFTAAPLSVAEQIIEARLQEARRLLRTPSDARLPIADVAQACGFLDAAHFSRRFRARFDMTPGELRRLAQGGPNERQADDRDDVAPP